MNGSEGRGTVINALAFHQCGAGQIPGRGARMRVEFVGHVLYSAPRAFLLGYSSFVLSSKTNI